MQQSNESERKALLQRGYTKRKRQSERARKGGGKSRHVSVRTWETRAEGIFQSANTTPVAQDPMALWMEGALHNGELARGVKPEPVCVFPSPQLLESRGPSYREGRVELERFLQREKETLGIDAALAKDVIFHVQNVVTWIATHPGMSKLLTRIFCVSKERTQFQSFKLWLRNPMTMISFFRTGKGLINGCDNLADVILSAESVLFHLWMCTGVLPFYELARSENITVSADTKHTLVLSKVKEALSDAGEEFKINYKAETFPGLSMVEKRKELLSAKGDPRKVSTKCFEQGKFTIVGPKTQAEVYGNAARMRRSIAFVLQTNS